MTKLLRVSRIRLLGLVPMAALLLMTASMPAQQLQDPPTTKGHAKATQPASVPGQNGPDRSSSYYHYGLAQLYEEMAVSAGRPDYATQAVEEYKLALNADPNSVLLQDGLAELYLKLGRVQEAISTAKDQVKRNPDDVKAHTLLGQVYVRLLSDMQGAQSTQMLQSAIGEYETIARLQPDDLDSKLLLGQLYALNHDSAKAEAEFKSAQQLDANSEDVVLNMAKLYDDEHNTQRAADTLLAVPPQDRTARMEFNLGVYFDELKKPKEAAAAYKRSLDIEPDNPDAQRALAGALQEDNHLDEALALLNTMVAADPTDVVAEMRISEIERLQGHYNDALASLEKAKAQTSPDMQEEVSYNEALIYDALGKYDQAVGVLTGVLDSTSNPQGKYTEDEKRNRATFLNRLGNVYSEQNKVADAVATYKQMADLGGDYAHDGYMGEVDAYREAHQWKDAFAAAEAAAKVEPKDHGVQMVYAEQLADMGQVDQALALAKAQLTGDADDRDTLQGLASIYIRLKRYKEAGQQLDKAELLSTKPAEKLDVYYIRGELYDRQKMYDQAEAEYRKALAIDPQNAGVLNNLGYMLADQGEKLPEALKMIRRAVELEPQNPAYLDSLGWVYFKTGQYPLAEENLRKAIERTSGDPAILDHLGEVYEKTGNLKLAVAQWERSMTEYAHSLPADADPEDVAKVQRKLESARVKLAKLTSSTDKDAK